MSRRACLAAVLALLGPDADAQAVAPPKPAAPDSYEARLVATLPRYVPGEPVSGTIRLWGHGNRALPWMRNLVDKWEAGFRKFHPGASGTWWPCSRSHGT